MSEVCKHEAIDERGRCECGAVLLHQPNAGNRPSKPSRVRELADHIQNNDDACSVCWEAASALSAYAAILDEPDQLYALLVKRGWSQQDADQIAQGRVPSEARGPFPDGDWLWGKLMDWCREHGAHPANYNDLFAIVDEARKARAANEPLTVYGADPASEQRGEVVAAEAPNAAAAKAVQPDGPAIDVVSAIHRHAKELARLTETWPADSAPPPPDVQAWVPVSERLPESSLPVLAFVTNSNGKTRRLRAHWIAKHTDEMWDGDMDGDYSEETDTTYTPEGWYETNEYEDTHWRIHDPVTHWMPLPSPPQTKGAE